MIGSVIKWTIIAPYLLNNYGKSPSVPTFFTNIGKDLLLDGTKNADVDYKKCNQSWIGVLPLTCEAAQVINTYASMLTAFGALVTVCTLFPFQKVGSCLYTQGKKLVGKEDPAQKMTLSRQEIEEATAFLNAMLSQFDLSVKGIKMGKAKLEINVTTKSDLAKIQQSACEEFQAKALEVVKDTEGNIHSMQIQGPGGIIINIAQDKSSASKDS